MGHVNLQGSVQEAEGSNRQVEVLQVAAKSPTHTSFSCGFFSMTLFFGGKMSTPTCHLYMTICLVYSMTTCWQNHIQIYVETFSALVTQLSLLSSHVIVFVHLATVYSILQVLDTLDKHIYTTRNG